MSLGEGVHPSGDQEVVERYAQAYAGAKKGLIRHAETEMRKGISHRNPPFQVGCSILIDMSSGLAEVPEIESFSGHNVTPTPGERKPEDKRCAERNAIEGALSYGGRIMAIVIASREISTGDEVNKSQKVLHPCRECRDMIRELRTKGLLRGETIICSVNTKKVDKKRIRVPEETTVNKLLALYADDVKETVVESEPQPTVIFPIAPAGAFSLS